MKPVIDKKWRKQSPAVHKAYGEKRGRDTSLDFNQQIEDLIGEQKELEKADPDKYKVKVCKSKLL